MFKSTDSNIFHVDDIKYKLSGTVYCHDTKLCQNANFMTFGVRKKFKDQTLNCRLKPVLKAIKSKNLTYYFIHLTQNLNNNLIGSFLQISLFYNFPFQFTPFLKYSLDTLQFFATQLLEQYVYQFSFNVRK